MPLPQLRPYQLDIARAVLASVRERAGRTFTVEISRQGGKNELSSQLELLLLTLHFQSGGDSIKAAPTFRPQALISLARLRERLLQAGFKGQFHTEHGYGIRLGAARQLFLSAELGSNIVGHTASNLLEVDEAQDVDKDKFDKELRPMGATTNVTTVLWGTPWDDFSLLETTKQHCLELERRDGIQRSFHYPWPDVARSNPAYRQYVEAERDRLGADHPLFLSQYELRPIGRTGRLFDANQLAQLRGDHPQVATPHPGETYVGGLDLAGADETAEDLDTAASDRRDSTVLTIGQLAYPNDPLFRDPIIRAVNQFADAGTKHAALYPRLLDLARTWRLKRLVVDATGIGAGVASYLTHMLGRTTVQPYVFTAPSKSNLAFNLLTQVNAGRLKIHTGPEASELWRQAQLARTQLRLNRQMNFYVDPREGHDDHLMSLALLAEAARDLTPRTAKGRKPSEP